jgi:RNA polymerase sigma-70 factor (ECF subfamily)
MTAREMPLGSPAFSVEPPFESDPAPQPGGPPGSHSGGLPACDDGAEIDAARPRESAPLTFDAVYQAYAPFVWRNARRLGVPASAAEDVMQEVFLVVHRRFTDFEEGTSMRAWLSAILIRVVRAFWRARRRKNAALAEAALEPDANADTKTPSPLEATEHDADVRELYALLSGMNEERREILVLSDIEELRAPEIAQALNVNINTVYWRLRTARKEFERAVVRHRARREAAERGIR